MNNYEQGYSESYADRSPALFSFVDQICLRDAVWVFKDEGGIVEMDRMLAKISV